MDRSDILTSYFNWLVEKTGGSDKYSELLHCLDMCWFLPDDPRDKNRAKNGEDLRWHFIYENGLKDDYDEIMGDVLNYPCTVLEMMIAIAENCELLMSEFDSGDKTGEWFWCMINNLKLSNMDDDHFNSYYVYERLDIFFTKEYKPDGEGGLFHIPGYDKDIRELDILYQMYAWLNEIE